MSLAALPMSSPKRKLAVWILVPVCLLIAGLAAWAFVPSQSSNVAVSAAKTYTVVPTDFSISYKKDGELAAVNNIEIISEVEGTTTIQTIIDEGATVKKGDTLITLDSSAIKQKIEDTQLDLQRAEADLTTAVEMKDIQESQNSANMEAANVSLLLAQLDLKQYDQGTYPQLVANASTDLDMARINLKNQEEKLSQTKELFLKNFVTATAVKDDELSVTTARNTVIKAETALRVLQDYTHQMDSAAKQNQLSQSKQSLTRTERQNASNLAQRVADVNAKSQALELLKRRMQRFQYQLAACTIVAPADGLVVYATSGDRFSQNTPIQEGVQVREQQRLIRLPDTSSMKSVVRINESQVSRLREGQRARVRIVGVPDMLGATLTKISVLADSGQRQFNPDIKEYPVDLTFDQTPAGLKPGMGSMAEIFIDRAESVLAVPVAALYSAGQNTYVFIQSGDQFVPHPVQVGRTNETLAELTGESVKSGDNVLLLQVGQGQQLLEAAGIKVAPTTQQSDGEPGSGRRGRRGGRRGGAGGGGVGGADTSLSQDSAAPNADAGEGRRGGRGGRGNGDQAPQNLN